MNNDKTAMEHELQSLKRENDALRETVRIYQNHLERVIEHQAVEKYRSVVQKEKDGQQKLEPKLDIDNIKVKNIIASLKD
ncbi:hypothetical protein HCG83_13015 [Enterococcus casseliflavus]|uniref:hypothetical protein n=1 Tax=Enterococcus casseliflavus TaxID=37734 RepID=UPI001C8CC88A|nr:hypothetical protein [Enterococcus casseliflavus]MBX9117224.1 hypothetical protein [Enterococcus casseliflavus]MBX9127690.1 hypothetical protein [Enterococcus casseliflavus]